MLRAARAGFSSSPPRWCVSAMGSTTHRETAPAPDGKFSLYILAYWPDKAIIDGSWMPEANAGGGTIGRQQ